ncbi:hypothetical protein MKX03_015206 [Papaver bracteatum]|nr:hypothetical protein MKX03_015206 [Papaver bracteatum]
MAKASFSPFLVGFLLVLFVADIAYVHGQSCNAVFAFGKCEQCDFTCGYVFGIDNFDFSVCDIQEAVNWCLCCLVV